MAKNGVKEARLERVLSASFRASFMEALPNAFYFKLPDTFGIGGMHPFDAFAVINGHAICIEFKRGAKTKVTPYQEFWLDRARAAGAKVFVVNEENKALVLKALVAIAKG